MKIRQSFLLYTLLLMGAILVFASSCKKGEEDEISELITGTFTDYRDDTDYKTITIGKQVWMAENLRFLPDVAGSGAGSATTPYYYVYGYNGTNVDEAKASANYTTYGVLYNWRAAMAGSASSTTNPSGVQGICPSGWHLPGDVEWAELSDYLGGKSLAGGKLKETGTSYWSNPNEGATNKSGFTALPGGVRRSNGAFGLIGYNGYWWSAFGTHYAWYHSMTYNGSSVVSYGDSKELGFSVRCVKD